MKVALHPRASDLGVEVGLFGGSGFYDFVDDAVDIDTPFGPAASSVRVGKVSERRVAFLARHGRNHRFAAHRVPFRANVLGARIARRPIDHRALLGRVVAAPPRGR